MLSVADALQVIISQVKPLASEALSLSAPLLGRVLASSYDSDIDSPPFTKSMMDGFAVRSIDCKTIGVTLEIVEEIPAGYFPKKTLGEKQAARIMTGAPLPQGADSIVPKEICEDSQDRVKVLSPIQAGEFVIYQGEEYERHETVLHSGVILQPQHIGLLAAIGQTSVNVHRLPSVAVLPTGSELVESPTLPTQGQIRNTNGPMLLAQVQRAGATPISYPIGRDDRQELREQIEKALSTADVLLLSGGVSVGKYDFIPEILSEVGATTHFHKVQMKPGRPILFATLDEKIIFGLPGNPVSSFACFELFVRPALRLLKGETVTGHTFVNLPLAQTFITNNNRPTYGPATITFTSEGPKVTAQSWFGSADLRGLGECNALIEVEAGQVNKKAGEGIRCLLL